MILLMLPGVANDESCEFELRIVNVRPLLSKRSLTWRSVKGTIKNVKGPSSSPCKNGRLPWHIREVGSSGTSNDATGLSK